MADVPEVSIRIWVDDAVVLYDWLMEVDINAVPITHPAQKQALTDLLSRFEYDVAGMPDLTHEQVEISKANVARDMGW